MFYVLCSFLIKTTLFFSIYFLLRLGNAYELFSELCQKVRKEGAGPILGPILAGLRRTTTTTDCPHHHYGILGSEVDNWWRGQTILTLIEEVSTF